MHNQKDDLRKAKLAVLIVIPASIIFWLIIAVFMLSSCSHRSMISGLETSGQIVKTDQDRVLVVFEDKMGKPGWFATQWFYFPGVGIVSKEQYRVKVILEPITDDIPTDSN